jgi:hypothetical protein
MIGAAILGAASTSTLRVQKGPYANTARFDRGAAGNTSVVSIVIQAFLNSSLLATQPNEVNDHDGFSKRKICHEALFAYSATNP